MKTTGEKHPMKLLKLALGTVGASITIVMLSAQIAAAVPYNPSTCSQFRNSSTSCFMDYDGAMRGYCEVCREGASCFMALDGTERAACEAYREDNSCFMALDGTERAACEAYREDNSCFMAFNGSDRGWCKVLKESASCDQALSGVDRENCERGFFPLRHREWLFFWGN
jgi:hypothetical protein